MTTLVQPTKKQKPVPPTLGPIADLEKHLPGDWWRHLFNSIYLKTDADVVENDANTMREIDHLIDYTKVEANDRVLDLCCGQGRHSLALAKRGFAHITGLDRSRYLIRLARKRAQEQSRTLVQFREGDARKMSFPDQAFDLVMLMGNSFGYFEREEENLAVLKEIYRLLEEGGQVYLDITDGKWMRAHFSPRSWEWIDQRMLVCRERSLSSDQTRLITREVVIDAYKGIITDQFYAERLYGADELKAALKESGFSDIQIHTSLHAESTRAQGDLGMMANRLLITAAVKDKPIRQKKPSKLLQKKIECTVLMGDPSLPDKVKKGGHFNQEDFDTINKLKEALSTLDDFNFYYLNDHKKLLSNLQRHPPTFVLNLCDEGYLNDPFKELHVPSLLEMLNIPYTGAGPTTLGVCYNKGLVNAWAKDMGIPTPDEIWIDDANFSAALPSEFPVLVKPAFGDSSIGITQKALAHNAQELVDYFSYLRTTLPNTPILVQEYLMGREFTVGLVGNGDRITALPILEVDYSALPANLPPILGYESKWLPESPYWTSIRYVRSSLAEDKCRELIDNSILLFQRLGLRDYGRFDFRMDSSGTIKLLEVNPNPGWCWDGKFNLMAEMGGWSYPQLLANVMKAALERTGLA